ncbi:unnamed protein product [Darwinula stevensoni]|uniref:Uncharacterized protein n=1 Tax=Darwinula stevensoni TaxID=69355 RepID=A0A7R8XJJ5_9CRUS|nr:unnamed protein product [Darwinula stevensoni]CAG0892288.1 unnamed protein product [Darwinula stevensoni]
MANKVAIDDGAKGEEVVIRFEDEGGETVGIVPVTVRFLNRFTGHALGRTAFPESSLFRRLFWLLVFLLAFGYMTYGIIDIIKSFISSPKTTSTQIEPQETLAFPVINICVQKHETGDLPFEFSGIFAPLEKMLVWSGDLQEELMRLSETSDTNQRGNTTSTSLSDDDVYETNLRTLENQLGQNKYLLDGYSKYSGKDCTDDIVNCILHCSFNGLPCNDSDFESYFHSTVGHCLTFNYGKDKKVQRHDYPYASDDIISDSRQGLRLVLAPHSSQHLNQLPSVGGYRLFVRDLQDFTFSLEKGFDADLGMASFAALKMTEYERIPLDQGGDCSPDSYLFERFDPNIFKVTKNSIYTQSFCQELCVAAQMLRDHKDSLSCLEDALDDVMYIDYSEIDCNETFYYAVLDMESKKKLVNSTCGCPPVRCIWQVAVIGVLYESMSKELTTEILLYPWSSFIGTFGGLLGLYTGMSFVSVLEMLEWIFDIVVYGWRKPKHDKMGPKRRAILDCPAGKHTDIDDLMRKKNRGKADFPWGEPPVYNMPSARETRSAGFDLAFSEAFSDFHF